MSTALGFVRSKVGDEVVRLDDAKYVEDYENVHAGPLHGVYSSSVRIHRKLLRAEFGRRPIAVAVANAIIFILGCSMTAMGYFLGHGKEFSQDGGAHELTYEWLAYAMSVPLMMFPVAYVCCTMLSVLGSAALLLIRPLFPAAAVIRLQIRLVLSLLSASIAGLVILRVSPYFVHWPSVLFFQNLYVDLFVISGLYLVLNFGWNFGVLRFQQWETHKQTAKLVVTISLLRDLDGNGPLKSRKLLQELSGKWLRLFTDHKSILQSSVFEDVLDRNVDENISTAQFAARTFKKYDPNDTGEIFARDFTSLTVAETRKLLKRMLLFDAMARPISFSEWRAGIREIFRARDAELEKLSNQDGINGVLYKILIICYVCVISATSLVIWRVDFWAVFVPILSLLVGFAFVFGSYLNRVFQSLVFVLFARLFEPGDSIAFNGEFYSVVSVGPLSTSLLQLDNRLVTIPNIILQDYAILNLTRSKSVRFRIPLEVEIDTGPGQLYELGLRVRNFVLGNPSVFSSSFSYKLLSLNPSSNALTILTQFNLTRRFHYRMDDWLDVRTEVILFLSGSMHELGIRWRSPVRVSMDSESKGIQVRSGSISPPMLSGLFQHSGPPSVDEGEVGIVHANGDPDDVEPGRPSDDVNAFPIPGRARVTFSGFGDSSVANSVAALTSAVAKADTTGKFDANHDAAGDGKDKVEAEKTEAKRGHFAHVRIDSVLRRRRLVPKNARVMSFFGLDATTASQVAADIASETSGGSPMVGSSAASPPVVPLPLPDLGRRSHTESRTLGERSERNEGGSTSSSRSSATPPLRPNLHERVVAMSELQETLSETASSSALTAESEETRENP